MANEKQESIYEYAGAEGDVLWDERLCIHVGECGRAKGDLFVSGRKPWCQPDVTALENVGEVVQRCPTGALTLRRKDGAASESAEPQNTVVVSANGPLYVRGDLAVDGASPDMQSVKFRAALCRCGASSRKPFCDGSHVRVGFADSGAVGESGEAGIVTREALTVRRAANGPLLLSGPFVIVAGTGRMAYRGTKAALCRCGNSKNKPFCDGTHKQVGFVAE